MTFEKATELVRMLSPLVQEKMALVQENHPTLPVKLQVKLARIYAMEEKNLSTEQMMIMWEAYDITTR